jgi:hypothetical protein
MATFRGNSSAGGTTNKAKQGGGVGRAQAIVGNGGGVQKVKRRSIHFILENEARAKAKTPGLQQWIGQGELIKKLLDDPSFKSISSHAKLKKEMTEASSQCAQLDWLAATHDDGIFKSGGEGYFIVDICCGKGFFGLLASHLLPKAEILLLDKNKKIKMGHFASIENVSFELLDIRSGHFLKNMKASYTFSLATYLGEKFQKSGKTKILLFGTHLCGILSRIVMETFHGLLEAAPRNATGESCQTVGVFLVPCCFPKRCQDYDLVNEARKQGFDDTMEYWVNLLLSLGGSGGKKRKHGDAAGATTGLEDCAFEHIRMQHMLSEKNHLIRACARPEERE